MSQLDDDQLVSEAEREEGAVDLATIPVGGELVADSLPDYVRAWFARLRAGESGKLPVIIGMVIIAVIFILAAGRSHDVPEEHLGPVESPGIMVVDRYKAYQAVDKVAAVEARR